MQTLTTRAENLKESSLHALSQANKLAFKNHSLMILGNEDYPVIAAVEGKENDDDFINAIYNAIDQEQDCYCEIISVEPFDYGYSFKIKSKISRGNEEINFDFIATFCKKY